MTEYIERKRAIVDACNSLELYPSEYAELEDALNKIPAADVAPIRYGRWKLNTHYGDHECSVCGNGDVIAPFLHFENEILSKLRS